MKRTHLIMSTLILAGACSTDASVTGASDLARTSITSAGIPGLAAARAATGRFQSFENAKGAGYTFLFMNKCMVDESGQHLGGMGLHYVNPDLLDGELDPATPEAVLYEPQANGQRRLVALEYVIPAEAWTSPEPPELFGRKLVLNAFNLWALHVWLWKDNPSGLFADWNPEVNCDNAGAVTIP